MSNWLWSEIVQKMIKYHCFYHVGLMIFKHSIKHCSASIKLLKLGKLLFAFKQTNKQINKQKI